MGLFKKKADPITSRARALNAEISALEARIRKLNQQVQAGPGPRWRSTVYPSGPPAPGNPHAATEPIFEEVGKLTGPSEPPATPQHFNELGVPQIRSSGRLAAPQKAVCRTPPGQSQADQLSGGGQHPGPASFALRKAHSPQTVLCAGRLGWLPVPRTFFLLAVQPPPLTSVL